MRVAKLAQHFDPIDEHAHIRVGMDVLICHRSGETRPTGAGIELGSGAEHGIAAADAAEETGVVNLIVGARERRVGALPARDVKLLGIQQLAPLSIGANDLLCRDWRQWLARVCKRYDDNF